MAGSKDSEKKTVRPGTRSRTQDSTARKVAVRSRRSAPATDGRRSGRKAAGGLPWWRRLLRHDGAPTPGLRGLRMLVVGLGLMTFIVAILLFVRGPRGREVGLGPDLTEDPQAAGFGPGARAFALYFVDAGGELVPEMRDVAEKRSRTRQIEAVIEELLTGSVRGHRPALPGGTMLRNLFADDAGTVYIDLTRDAIRGQPGNYSAEYASLASLVRTVLSNFQEFAAVQILIDGEPATTLAGHFNIQRPLPATDWLAQ